jgi:flagellar hook-basal body complex protein FliE
MIDHLTNPAAAANAYAKSGKTIDAPGLGAPKGDSFADIVKNAAIKSINTLRAGEAASARAVSGEASLPEVVQAITASEVTLQTVVAMRDRMVGAYQEIMRMPV